METIGHLAGGIAHDFNNLLTVISGNVEALERRLPDDPRLRRFVEAAMRGIERAVTLIDRLLAFARRQVLETKLADVNLLVLGMSDLLHRTLGERIRCVCRWRNICHRLSPTPVSLKVQSSTLPSIRMTPCKTAAHWASKPRWQATWTLGRPRRPAGPDNGQRYRNGNGPRHPRDGVRAFFHH
jgi:hypothetical protein